MLKHCIRVCRLLRPILNYVPVLDYFPVLEAENVDDRAPSVLRIRFGIVVNCNQVSFSDHSFYFGPGFRVLFQIWTEKVNGSLCARGCIRIMLFIVRNTL
jgi:hypothetical protein